MEDAYDCGLIIKELREKAGLTQRELGQKVNRDKGTISRYENNYQPIPFETMRIFASVFNVSMDYLAGMKKHSTVSTAGLTSTQAEIITELTNIFRCFNQTQSAELSAKKYEIIGKIASELTKN